MNFTALIEQQKLYFNTGATKDISLKKALLKKLKQEILHQEEAILKAIHQDFKKSYFESYATEIGIVITEINLFIKKLDSWSKPKVVMPSLLNFPSWSRIYNDPYGSVLIISPWNYPFQLAFSPLIGAIAAGNTVVLKPSELTPNTSAIIKIIIDNVFSANHVTVVEGGIEKAQELLAKRWDYIFFTGSVPVGKIIYQAAAQYLTPVTLELGGKSPCIIDESANIPLGAKRLVWGKFLNGGQTCIAPDYILIHYTKLEEFTQQLKVQINKAYGENPEESEDFPRIINQKNFDRLSKMIANQKIIIGGHVNPETLYIAPTVLENPPLNSEVMQDEIFGPILPIITFKNLNDINKVLLHFEKPLSFYVFSNNIKTAREFIKNYSFGGGVINDTLVHFANHRLPFGGVGHSGIGGYHGKNSYLTFSHQKGVTRRFNWLDIPTRYAPYTGKLKQVKQLFKYFS